MNIRMNRMIALISLVPALLPLSSSAEDTTTPASQSSSVYLLAEEVDVLQIAADLKLTEKQITYVLAKVEALKKNHDAARAKEEALLKEIQEPLTKMRDSLAAGKSVPELAEQAASGKRKDLDQIRLGVWQEFQSSAVSCAAILDEGQIRTISRSPEALQRARQMVSEIRSSSPESWPGTLNKLTEELLEVKKLDKQADWNAQAQEAEALSGQERELALKDLEKQKVEDIAQMRSEISGLLTSIRGADQRVLSVGINKLASALRSKVEVQSQLIVMMGRVLNSPAAESALKRRLSSLQSQTTDQKP